MGALGHGSGQDTVSMADGQPQVEELTAYLDGVVPLTDEIRSLKMRLRDEVMQLFNPDAPWT